MKKIFLPFFAAFLFLSNLILVYAEDLTQYQQAILNTAKAYYNRGVNIQYDEPALTYQGLNYIFRDDIFFNPEDAISSNNQYTVCSHFVHTVYYNTFEKDEKNYIFNKLNEKTTSYGYFGTYYLDRVSKPGTAQYNKDVTVLRIENPSVKIVNNERVYDQQKLEQSKAAILAKVEPGDIIVYRRTTSTGHAILYVGNDEIYQSGGIVYYFDVKKDNKESNGSINKKSLSKDMLNDKNILKPVVTSVSILRPLNEINSNGYKLNSNAKARLNYPNLYIEKVATNSRYATVSPNGTITYTITLTNKGNSAYSNILVKDIVPTNTTYVSSSPTAIKSGSNLNWKVSLKVGETKTIKFTIRVKNDKSLNGKYIVSKDATVGGIKINEIDTLVGNTIDDSLKTKLKNRIASIDSNSSKTYTSTKDYINDVYDDSHVKIDLINTQIPKYFTTSTLDITGMKSSPITSNYYHGNKDTGVQTIYKLKKNLTVNDMYINGLYGGIYTIDENNANITSINRIRRMRYLKPQDLMFGDVLIINDPDLKATYLMDEGNRLITLKNKRPIKLTTSETIARLDSLLGQNNFIVLRPSLAMKPSLKFTLYDQDSKKVISGAKLKLQMKNGSNWKDIKEYTTNSSGVISVTDLDNGEYRFVQTKYLDHYNTSSFKMYSDSSLKNVVSTFQVSGSETKIYGTNRRVTYTVTYKPGTKGNFTEKKYTVPYGDKLPTYTPSDNGDWKFDKWDKTLASTVTSNIVYTALWYKNVKVTARYFDINTNKPIIDSVVDINRNGTSYKTTKKTIPNYTYVKVDGKESGTRGEEDIVVTYYYKTKTATLKVIHSDCDNNKVLKQNSSTVTYGSEYTTSPNEVLSEYPNYRLVSTPTNYKGIVNDTTVKKGVIEVKYCYAKKDSKVIPSLDVTGTSEVTSSKDKLSYKIAYKIEFKDYIGTSKIKVVKKLPHKIDTTKSKLANGTYDSKNLTITWEEEKNIDSYKNPNYSLIKDIELVYTDNYAKEDTLINNITASITANNKTQTTKKTFNTIVNIKGKIIVKYIDKETNKVLDEVTKTGKVGNKYTLEAREFKDYVLVDKPEDKTAEYKEEKQEFKYTYKQRDPNSEEEPIIEDNPKPKEEDKSNSKNLITIIIIIIGGLFGGIVAFLTRRKHNNSV